MNIIRLVIIFLIFLLFACKNSEKIEAITIELDKSNISTAYQDVSALEAQTYEEIKRPFISSNELITINTTVIPRIVELVYRFYANESYTKDNPNLPNFNYYFYFPVESYKVQYSEKIVYKNANINFFLRERGNNSLHIANFFVDKKNIVLGDVDITEDPIKYQKKEVNLLTSKMGNDSFNPNSRFLVKEIDYDFYAKKIYSSLSIDVYYKKYWSDSGRLFFHHVLIYPTTDSRMLGWQSIAGLHVYCLPSEINAYSKDCTLDGKVMFILPQENIRDMIKSSKSNEENYPGEHSDLKNFNKTQIVFYDIEDDCIYDMQIDNVSPDSLTSFYVDENDQMFFLIIDKNGMEIRQLFPKFEKEDSRYFVEIFLEKSNPQYQFIEQLREFGDDYTSRDSLLKLDY